jgi:hypothetical protein
LQDSAGRSAFHFAAITGSVEISRMLANSIVGEQLEEGSGAADVIADMIALIKDQIAAGTVY